MGKIIALMFVILVGCNDGHKVAPSLTGDWSGEGFVYNCVQFNNYKLLNEKVFFFNGTISMDSGSFPYQINGDQMIFEGNQHLFRLFSDSLIIEGIPIKLGSPPVECSETLKLKKK